MSAGLRAPLKALAESLLLHGGPARVGRRRVRGGALILAYHNVVPDDAAPAGDRSLHLPRAAFAAQLDRLAATCDVVPLAAVLAPTAPRATARPRVAITFDDAYRGAVTLGVRELARRGLPATIFVTPAFIGGGTFWWDACADPAGAGLAPEVRRHALEALAGRDAAVRAWHAARGGRLAEVPPHLRVATEAELAAALAAHAGLALGSHTWSHPNLTRLDAAALADELARPLAWLRERYARVLPWVTYPYGLATPGVAEAARAAGYEAGCLVSGGWLLHADTARAEPWLLPRFNVPAGISARGFALRLAGLACR